MCVFIYAVEELCPYRHNDRHGDVASTFTDTEAVFIRGLYRNWNRTHFVQRALPATPDIGRKEIVFMIIIRHCSSDSDFSLALQITKDYIEWLDMDLSFQDVDTELATYSSMYAPPNGLFLLARHAGELAGGIGLRMFAPEVCEMKRLFVYERFRNQHIAHALCKEIIREATGRGYKKMRLDTLGHMQAAIRLYEALGFRDIAPYRFNPDPSTRYMELQLR